MTLFEDSLIQYDELEASFFQHVKGELTELAQEANPGQTDQRELLVSRQNTATPPGWNASAASLAATTQFRCSPRAQSRTASSST